MKFTNIGISIENVISGNVASSVQTKAPATSFQSESAHQFLKA